MAGIDATMIGGDFLFSVEADSTVVDALRETGITLGGLYADFKLARPSVDTAVKKALGGERDDQELRVITSGSLALRIPLHCFTNERFLKVLADYESGEIKNRLEEEFSQIGIKVEGLKVEIENVAEVNETKEAINKSETRSYMDAEAGYDPDHFISTVPPSLVCVICKHVVRKPRLCKDGEHCFCFSCISRYINESQTCPVCRKRLTAKTLVAPQACLKRVWRELQIKCDYVQRGCPDPIQLGNLEDHVSHCGFAPVACGKCGMQLNRKDKDNHEKSFCQLGGAKCQECENVKANQDQMKQELCQLKARLTEMSNNQDEITARLDVAENAVPAQLDEIMNDHEEYMGSMVEGMNEMKRKYDQMENDGREMKQKFELFIEKSKRIADVQLFSTSDREIIIIGGTGDEDEDAIYDSVNVFSPANGTYAKLPPMNCPRQSASSCVYKNEVIVAGGFDGKTTGLDTIEILKINQDLSRWTTTTRGKLPCRLTNHVLKVYQEKLLLIGGINRDTQKASNEIHELALDEPYTPTLLATMPQPRAFHSAEIVNDKLFILGGAETTKDDDKGNIVDSVLMYDFITKEFKTCGPLLKPVSSISTVTWGNKIIVVGGMDKNFQPLDDVIMYGTETGRSVNLPSLNHKRTNHSAVICDDVIFVLGGWNLEEGHLNSVESLKIDSDENWKELPSMREKRQSLTVVVKP